MVLVMVASAADVLLVQASGTAQAPPCPPAQLYVTSRHLTGPLTREEVSVVSEEAPECGGFVDVNKKAAVVWTLQDMTRPSDNDEPPKGHKRGRGKRKRSRSSTRPSGRRLAALRCSSSSSCSSTTYSLARSPGGARLSPQTLHEGPLRRMQRRPAMTSKMVGHRYRLGKSHPTDLAQTLAEALAHEPCPGDEMPGPSKRPVPLQDEHRPKRRRKSGRLQQSSEQPESTDSSEAVRPAKAPRKARLERLYQKGPLLGKGGYGSVFSGVRKFDGLPVAIKFVSKLQAEEEIELVSMGPLPLEVALMKRVCAAPESAGVLHVLDWFNLQTQYALVLERPEPCQDLLAFCLDRGGRVDEGLARRVTTQLIGALLHCARRGVLHRDVKPENILIRTDTHAIKLFDFGCGDLWKSTAYKDFAGTLDYIPPEWFLRGKYHAGPATVWSVGVTLYSMVSGFLPFGSPRQIITGRLRLDDDLSQECRDLIRWCLSPKAAERPTLEQMQLHPWLQ
ncbi:serine/threonine-protein kinase pim-1-like [Sardina pilchardus]|uniref:serine/threonine-protein kinase pim-1-like n=1 Tax=Sardina pilchardus TaxID=27697 RepID=UPI002E0F0CF6